MLHGSFIGTEDGELIARRSSDRAPDGVEDDDAAESES
jgi:hypothetical protein